MNESQPTNLATAIRVPLPHLRGQFTTIIVSLGVIYSFETLMAAPATRANRRRALGPRDANIFPALKHDDGGPRKRGVCSKQPGDGRISKAGRYSGRRAEGRERSADPLGNDGNDVNQFVRSITPRRDGVDSDLDGENPGRLQGGSYKFGRSGRRATTTSRKPRYARPSRLSSSRLRRRNNTPASSAHGSLQSPD